MKRLLSCLTALLISVPAAPGAARLKELVSLEGVRENQLIGYGLVVGLAGTGDKRQTVFSAQSLTNLLQRMGLTVPPTAIQVKNTAGVMVTASLPPFAQPGVHLDVTVAAIGDASNLQGGILLMTGLKGVNGEVYSVAQGPVVTGGFIAGPPGNSQALNHPTVGRVPNGAIVERGAPSVLGPQLHLQLREADFTTSTRIAAAINKRFTPNDAAIAHPDNSALVSVKIPAEFANRSTEFVAELEILQVDADRAARIVVNERTGTIVMGKEVRISPVAILHGGLTVEVQTTYTVSQPNPLTKTGTTEVIPNTTIGVNEEKAKNIVLKQGATVEELVRALTAIGSTARDIIAILQNLRAAGALEAELEVI